MSKWQCSEEQARETLNSYEGGGWAAFVMDPGASLFDMRAAITAAVGAEVDALREALADAAHSLETLANGAGKATGIEDMLNVRCYANSRAGAASAVLEKT